MFITNDFRMGFTIEDTIGSIHWLVTERNWAGMAIASETIKPHMEKSKTELIKVSYHDIFEPAETLKVFTPIPLGLSIYSTMYSTKFYGSRISTMDLEIGGD